MPGVLVQVTVVAQPVVVSVMVWLPKGTEMMPEFWPLFKVTSASVHLTRHR